MTKTDTADTAKVIAEVMAGRHDGKLVDIVEAVGQRLRSSTVRFCWRLRLDGEEWTEQTVTSGELAIAEQLLKISYVNIDPRERLEHRIALVVAHLHKIHGEAIDVALKRAEAMTLAEQENLFELYEVTDDPKDDPAPSTSS